MSINSKHSKNFSKLANILIIGNGGRENSLAWAIQKNELVKKAGAWYSYKQDRIGQGKENAKAYLKEHPDIATELNELLRAELLPKIDDVIPAEDDVEELEEE